MRLFQKSTLDKKIHNFLPNIIKLVENDRWTHSWVGKIARILAWLDRNCEIFWASLQISCKSLLLLFVKLYMVSLLNYIYLVNCKHQIKSKNISWNQWWKLLSIYVRRRPLNSKARPIGEPCISNIKVSRLGTSGE